MAGVSRKVVLLVEDEHQVRTFVALLLEQLGFRVLEAAHPTEAANVWRRELETIDVIVADIWLPEISGPELVGFFRRERADVKALFITGMSPEIAPQFRKLTRNSEILEKPFTKAQLEAALKRLEEI